jgi:membrane-bound lytic murein transglycosylase D
VAINYAMQYHHAYNIYPAPTQYRYEELLTTSVPGGISFEQISRLTGISVNLLRFLNPVYKMDYIPVQQGPVRIVIPEDKIEVFHQQLPFFQTEEHPAEDNMQAYGDTTGRQKSTHIVNHGEFFHAIAMQYECRIEDIMIWNNLEEKHLYAGQELIVWEPVDKKNDPGIHCVDSEIESQWFKADIKGRLSEDEVPR